MGLVKRNKQTNGDQPADGPVIERQIDELKIALKAIDPATRRKAVRDLAGHPGAAVELCARLSEEHDTSVRSVLLTTLIKLRTEIVVEHLAPHLRSEDTALRNAVAEALQEMPEEVEPFMAALLADPDSDIRISAIIILGALRHPLIARWLEKAVEDEQHVNVCAAAVDCLAEVGDEATIPHLQAIATKFADEPFMTFAVEIAIRRIRGE